MPGKASRRTFAAAALSATSAVRVCGAKRDDLQSVITLVKKSITDFPVQFGNFRD